MIARPARQDELPYLTKRLHESDNEKVDLSRSLVWVAEQDGKICGLVTLRLIYQAEPMMVFPEIPQNSKRRAAYLMAKAMESWVADRSQNKTGIYSYFAVIKDKVFESLAKRWGLFHIYADCKTFGRDL